MENISKNLLKDEKVNVCSYGGNWTCMFQKIAANRSHVKKSFSELEIAAATIYH